MAKEGRNKIQGLSEKLYSRTRYQEPTDTRTPVKPIESPDVSESWQDSPGLDQLLQQERTDPVVHPWMKRLFAGALIFFVLTIVGGVFIFFGGANFISSRNVDINIVGPTTASAGEPIELGVSIVNENNANLELVNLSIQYPSGSRDPLDTSKSITYSKEELGALRAGAEAARNIPVVLIGSTGEVKEIKFSVEYKVAGSNATFYKDKIYEITIGSAPVSLNVETPRAVTSGDNFTTSVTITLNSIEILKGVTLKAEYPYGYNVTDTTPSATADNNLWILGDLSPGDAKTIQIRGKLVGENQEQRTIRFYVGVSESGSNVASLGNIVVSTLETIEIARPALGLDVLLNGVDTLTYVAPIAGTVSTSMSFQNNLPDKLFNPRLEVSLSGNALDKFSVRPRDNGFYNSSNNKINWSISNSQGLQELAPGQSGQVTFTFSSIPDIQPGSEGQEIVLNVKLSGVAAQNNISVSETRTVKISSQASLSAEALYSTGAFRNTGTIPPRAEERTTYTLVFNVGNTSNPLESAKLVAKLGQGVEWLSFVSNSSESVSYDSSNSTMVWDLGTVESGTGFTASDREISVQVALTPSVIQINTVPVLASGIVLSGTDSVSGQSVTVSNAPLTTRLTSDPAFIQGDDIVVE